MSAPPSKLLISGFSLSPRLNFPRSQIGAVPRGFIANRKNRCAGFYHVRSKRFLISISGSFRFYDFPYSGIVTTTRIPPGSESSVQREQQRLRRRGVQEKLFGKESLLRGYDLSPQSAKTRTVRKFTLSCYYFVSDQAMDPSPLLLPFFVTSSRECASQ